MPEIRVIESLVEVGRAEWDALFPGELESYDYLRAVEGAGLEGFRWRYVLALGAGRLIAAAPAFLTAYALDTTLTGPARRIAEAVRRWMPGALTLRLACLGSPCTETANVGFDPDIATDDRAKIFQAMLRAFEADARIDGCSLIGVKDAPAAAADLYAVAAVPLGYRPIAGQPTAELDIDFPDLDAYLERLSPGTRRDMRRKLRVLGAIRIEVTRDISSVLDQIVALYRQTRDRAEMSFEDLTPAFFEGVVRRMPERAFFVLYHHGEHLLAANLLLQDGDTLLDKFFCMHADRGRPFNLYFVSWFTNVRLCLERGLRHYQSGQAGYANKLRLGCRLSPTANYFRHRNVLLNGGLRLVAPLFAADNGQDRAA